MSLLLENLHNIHTERFSVASSEDIRKVTEPCTYCKNIRSIKISQSCDMACIEKEQSPYSSCPAVVFLIDIQISNGSICALGAVP